MARYTYQARTNHGELTTGSVQAASLDEAGRIVRGEGKFIVKLTLAPADSSANENSTTNTSKAKGKIKRAEVIFFTHQMSVMIQTGVPLSEALDCAAQQANNPAFRAVLDDVAKHVQGGGEFSAALRKHPKIFPNVMISLIRASEISGTMGTMLERISGYLTKEQATAKHIKSALMYPCFMMTMAVGVTIFLLAFVLPKFAKIYESRGAALPAPTRFLLALSHGLVAYWWMWLGGAIILGVGGYLFVKSSKGRRVFDYLKLNAPIFKHLFTGLYVSRACRTMGTMTAAGVSMLDMIGIVKEVTNNVYYHDLWDKVDERLRQGAQLSETLFSSTLIPRSVAQMIFSGEKSGRLGVVLSKVAEFTEEEFDRAVKTTTQFIEPVMVGAMGLIIGFVAISLLLPIFSVGKVVAGK
ncbi:MAG: type II secretion system F family protein [Phycisphaeraceae bacterium]|nr:type II secretion system F family protein [Phycisphaeraceae bacterium]